MLGIWLPGNGLYTFVAPSRVGQLTTLVAGPSDSRWFA